MRTKENIEIPKIEDNETIAFIKKKEEHLHGTQTLAHRGAYTNMEWKNQAWTQMENYLQTITKLKPK